MRTMHVRVVFGTTTVRPLLGVLVLVVGFLVPFGVPVSADAANCSGTSYTWTGYGNGRAWGDAQNWSPSGIPGATDQASIVSTGGEIFIDNPTSVCNLTLNANDGEVFFHAGTGITVGNDLNITGGSSLMHWDGNVTVDGTTTITGDVLYDATGDFPTDIETLSTANLVVAANSNVELTNGSTDIHSTGAATIGTSKIWSNGSSASDDIAQLQIDGSLTLTGNVDAEVDVVLDGAILDLAGHTLDINSHSYSWWSNATIKSSSPGGVVKFRDGNWLLLDHTVTVDSGATVQMQDDSRLSDSAHYAGEAPGESQGSAGVIAGDGNVDWMAGHLVGDVTLGPDITTTLDGNGDRRIEQLPGTVLTNRGRMVVVDGQLDVPADPGQIVNDGALVLDAGVTVTGSAVNTDIVNASGAAVQVAPSPLQSTAKTAVLEATVANHGTFNIPSGLTLQLNGGRVNALRQGGILTGGGTLDVTDQTTVFATGTTTIVGGSKLLYDGYNSFIEAGTVTPQGTWTTTGTFTTPAGKHGTLLWRQGQIDGHLSLTGALRVKITDPGNGAHRHLGGNADYHQTQLTLAAPTTVTNAAVDISDNSALLVSAPVTLAGAAPALGTGYGDASQGAILHVLPAGSVSVATPNGTVHTVATMDYPVVNSGTITVPTGGTLQLPTSFTQSRGILWGGGHIVGNVVVNGGSVRPSLIGGAPVALTIDGNYQQGAKGRLALLVAGQRTKRHDRLLVTGTASLSGTVAPVLKSGYRPTVGSKFIAVSAGARSGKFSGVISTGVPRHTHWKQVLGSKTVALKLVR